jgi:glutathionylspermidine synthase
MMLAQPEAQLEGISRAAKFRFKQHRIDGLRTAFEKRDHLVAMSRFDHLIAATPQIFRQNTANQHIAFGNYEASRLCT